MIIIRVFTVASISVFLRVPKAKGQWGSGWRLAFLVLVLENGNHVTFANACSSLDMIRNFRANIQ